MELRLDIMDLKPEYLTRSDVDRVTGLTIAVSQVAFEHLTFRAQLSVRAVGRGMFRWLKNHNMIYAPGRVITHRRKKTVYTTLGMGEVRLRDGEPWEQVVLYTDFKRSIYAQPEDLLDAKMPEER